MSQTNELRVFISSTFRDLQEEREHLVKKIFPEIRALCRERGITFTEVDLRWGLTEEDVALGRIVRTCLDEIDRCRPYFIGITGERYGYVPELHEYYKDAELLERFPWIEEAAMDGASIIDLEFRHAALNDAEQRSADAEEDRAAQTHLPGSAKRDEGRPGGVPVPDFSNSTACARFYFRRHRRGHEAQVDGAESTRLDDLKNRIRAAALPVEEFRDPGTLGEMVYDALVEILDRDFANTGPPTPLEEERSRHTAFATSRRHAYIPNPEYLKRLSEWFAAEEPPLVIYAESGSGKSSLVSFWCEQLRRRHPELPVIEHYVGIGAGDADHLGIMRHVMEEIRERFERTDELPSNPEAIELEFSNWLGFGVGQPLVIVIDGINQLTGRAQELYWLPPIMPAGLKLVITSTVEQTLVDLRSRGWRTLGMQPLTEREREAAVVRYLSEYRKALSAEQVGRIAADVKCAHPLFLRTLLEELRLDSSHEQLDARIDRYLASTGTEDLFQQVLDRMESDYSTRAVRDVMSLLWCSRHGLDETELTELTGIGRLKLSTMLSGLDYHLVRKDGVLTFFHDYLRRAVENRYVSNAESRRQRWSQLAEYYQRQDVGMRATLELLHALEALGDREKLEREVTRINRFEQLWRGSERYEVLRILSGSDPTRVESVVDHNLRNWLEAREPDEQNQMRVFALVAELYDVIGAWPASRALQHRRLMMARAAGERRVEAEALSELSNLHREMGDLPRSAELAIESERLSSEINDRHGVLRAVYGRGNAEFDRGEFAEALQCYQEVEQLSRELGDRKGIAGGIGNRGRVHQARGEYAEALPLIEESVRLFRELGDRRGAAAAVNNRGMVHLARGESSRALECYAEFERLSNELGDRRGVAMARNNRGNVLMARGEYAGALACFEESEQILESLGARGNMASIAANRGILHQAHGEYAEALACFRRSEALHAELDGRLGVANARSLRGLVQTECGEYEEALACFAQVEETSRELGDRRAAASAVGYRGAVHAARGEHSIALELLSASAAEHREIGFGYGLTYVLEEMAAVLLDVSHIHVSLPEFLPRYVDLTQRTDWRMRTVESARALAAECLEVSRELSKPDTLWAAQVLLARITAAEGDAGAARAELDRLLIESDSVEQPWVRDDRRADCHFWLWKLGDPDDSHRVEALCLYESMLGRTPKQVYRIRIEDTRRAIGVPMAVQRPTPPEETTDAVD